MRQTQVGSFVTTEWAVGMPLLLTSTVVLAHVTIWAMCRVSKRRMPGFDVIAERRGNSKHDELNRLQRDHAQ